MTDPNPVSSKHYPIWFRLSKNKYLAPSGFRPVGYHDLSLVAEYIRKTEVLDREWVMGFANKLDPSDPKKGRYKLMRPVGRPSLPDLVHGLLVAAMEKADLKVIADHLRESSSPDPRVRAWLVDRLDPPTPGDPHFIVKLPPGRPRDTSFPKKLADIVLAMQIDSKVRAGVKLDSALHAAKENHGISRTKARRIWKKHT